MSLVKHSEASPERDTSNIALPTIEIGGQTASTVTSITIKSEPKSSILSTSTPEFTACREHDLVPASDIANEIGKSSPTSDYGSHHRSSTHQSSSGSNKENASSRPIASPRHLKLKPPSHEANTPGNNTTAKHINSSSPVSTSGSSNGSGLKLKLRGVQGALQEWNESAVMQPVAASLSGVARHKRASYEEATYDEDDTDSEIELIAPTARVKKAAKPVVKTRSLSPVTKGHVRTTTMNKNKKAKLSHHSTSDDDDVGDVLFDTGEESEFTDEANAQKLSLMTPVMKRNKRILNLDKAEHTRLVANATKVGAEYYDSDESDVAGPVKDTTKPHLFRNVRWGAHATDYSDDAQFPTEPEFTQFVPGRFELQPDNTVADQKAKLIVKLTDIHGKKRIFANPPPRDWNDQVAITALNKRTVQQIRRNTHVRFRDVVVAYVAEERKWILDNLTNGKPTNGWKRFVDEFNAKFEGKVIEHVGKARPFRTHSSLTKEVERFGAKWYSKGLVPVPFKHSVKRGSKRSEL